jgi:hypothetical protein
MERWNMFNFSCIDSFKIQTLASIFRLAQVMKKVMTFPYLLWAAQIHVFKTWSGTQKQWRLRFETNSFSWTLHDETPLYFTRC